MLTYDRRSEPRVGERVPYVIIYGTPGLPLIQLIRRPAEVLQDPTLRLNATYYITKQILPPLARIFSLIGIDVFSWYHELPRVSLLNNTCPINISNFSILLCYKKFSKLMKMPYSPKKNWWSINTFLASIKFPKIQMLKWIPKSFIGKGPQNNWVNHLVEKKWILKLLQNE